MQAVFIKKGNFCPERRFATPLRRRMPPCYSPRAISVVRIYAHVHTRLRDRRAHYSGRGARVRWVDNILVAWRGNISYCYPSRFHKVNKSARAALVYMEGLN